MRRLGDVSLQLLLFLPLLFVVDFSQLLQCMMGYWRTGKGEYRGQRGSVCALSHTHVSHVHSCALQVLSGQSVRSLSYVVSIYFYTGIIFLTIAYNVGDHLKILKRFDRLFQTI